MSQAKKQEPPAKPQALVLPKRYDDILDERLKAARQVIEQVQKSAKQKPSRWNWRYLLLGLLGVVLAMSVGRDGSEAPKGSLPFDRAAVVSADTLGLAVQPSEFVTAKPKPNATPTPAPTPSPTPQAPRAASTVIRRPRPTPSAPPRGGSDRQEPGDEDLLLDEVAVHVPAIEDFGPRTLLPARGLRQS